MIPYWIVIVLMAGAASLFFLPPDNPVEQTAESIVLESAGISVDISGEEVK